jgi:hypothetical protein
MNARNGIEEKPVGCRQGKLMRAMDIVANEVKIDVAAESTVEASDNRSSTAPSEKLDMLNKRAVDIKTRRTKKNTPESFARSMLTRTVGSGKIYPTQEGDEQNTHDRDKRRTSTMTNLFGNQGRIKHWIAEWHKSCERAEEGNHVTIEVSTNIMSIGSVSTVNKSFIADLFVILHWRVSAKSFEQISDAEQSCKVNGPTSLTEFWAQHGHLQPSLEIVNAKDVSHIIPDVEERKYPRIDKDNPGFLKKTVRLAGVFRTIFDLHKFPFDCQLLEIKMKFRRMGEQDVQAVESHVRPSRLGLEGIENGDLIIVPLLESTCGKVGSASVYTLTLCTQRAWQRYFWNIIVMNFALGFMGWMVTIMMSPVQMESRLGNLKTLLLTAVAFKFAVSDTLPSLPFMTVLDQYVSNQ